MAVSSALGGAVRRREDPRLITGAGLYTDDVRLDRCLHAVFVRSSMAHARLKSVDVAAAVALPGVGLGCGRDARCGGDLQGG